MKAIVLNDLKQIVFETSIDVVLPNIEVKKNEIKKIDFTKENETIKTTDFETIIYVPVAIYYEKQK